MELKSSFKRDAANQLNAFIPDDNLELIKIHKNDLNNNSASILFMEEDEFLYCGMMYDIYKTEAIGDSIYYYCISDEKENILEKSFASYVHAKTSNNTSSNAIHNILENITKIGLTPDTSALIFALNSIKFVVYFRQHLTNLKADTPTPPPKPVS